MFMRSSISVRANRALTIACFAAGLGFSHAATNRLPCAVSWIGNSFPGAKKWVQQDIRGMLVTPAGEVYTAVEWDEAGREFGIYKDGDAVGNAGHTHGWGNNGGLTVAVNSKYAFLGLSMGNEGGGLKDTNTWPPKGFTWYGISRRHRADFTKGAPFPGGKGGKGDTLKECFLVINEAPEKANAHLAGLWADEQNLYISNPSKSRVEVWDAEAMTNKYSFPVDRPGPLLTTFITRFLWILQTATETQPASLLNYSAKGGLIWDLKFAPDARPRSLAYDPIHNYILLADSGPDQQIHFIRNLLGPPVFMRTRFGQKGGIFSGEIPGKFGDLRFNNPTGVGTDAAGNIYVASDGQSGGGGTVLESYTWEGKLNWRLFGLEFVDMGDFDPASDTDLYTKEEHFQITHTQPPGRDWSYTGYTIHPFKYPQDPRLHIWSAGAWARRLEGRLILFVNDMNAQYMQVYRFNPFTDGEIAKPAGLFTGRRMKEKVNWPPHQPEKGEWIWRDKNGNGAFEADEYFTNEGKDAPGYQGWWVDSAGNVWQAAETAGLRKFKFLGLDAHINPQWDFQNVEKFERPTQLSRIKRLRYYPETDTMYLGGTTGEHANQHWKPMGPVLCRFDDWHKPSRKLRWQIVAPYAKGSQGHESCEPMGFDVAGDFVFVPYTGASKAVGFSTGHIEIFRAEDGKSVGCLEPPPEIGEIGLQDIRECLTARRRANGEYVVLLEEDWKAKILMYRWKP
jgi:hypothetical protein